MISPFYDKFKIWLPYIYYSLWLCFGYCLILGLGIQIDFQAVFLNITGENPGSNETNAIEGGHNDEDSLIPLDTAIILVD